MLKCGENAFPMLYNSEGLDEQGKNMCSSVHLLYQFVLKQFIARQILFLFSWTVYVTDVKGRAKKVPGFGLESYF